MQKWFIGFVLVWATLFTSVVAGDSPRAVIVFDASGSMWGQINGVTKIEIARDALKNVVKEWNPDVELGLTVYGHRTKGDCNDIESVIPVGKINKNKVISTVMAIKPKGKTPISRSLRKVADELKYTEEKATIILISDGKETCDSDPCGAAKELEKEGIDFVTHVIGFNVDKKTDKQLECIAKATGGEYFSAKDAAALNEAIKVIAKKVEKEEGPIATSLELIAKYKTLGKSSLGISGPKWFVTQNGKSVYDNDDPLNHQPQINLMSGKAHIKMVYDKCTIPMVIERDTELKSKKENKEIFYIDNGTVKITASETEGNKHVKGSYHIYPIIGGEASNDEISWCVSDHSTSCKRELAIGKYLIKASYNQFKREKTFELTSGEVKKVHITFEQTGKVEISASEKEGGKWIEAYHRIFKVVDGVKDDSQLTSFASRKKSAGKDQIAVGKYIVHSEYNEFEKETPFEIKAGEVTKIHVVMGQTGEIEISASEKEGGKWIEAYHRIYKVIDGVKDDSQLTSFASRKKSAGKDQIAVGKYIVHSEYNEFEKETPFEIKADEVTKIHVVMGQTGEIEISASEKEGGKWIEAYHRIFKVVDGVKDDSQLTSFASRKKSAGKDQIAVGKYIVHSEYNEFEKETPFEIKAGETTKVHIIFSPFFIGAKCPNMGSKVSYEIYGSDGRMVFDKKAPCSDTLKVILDDGDYSIEAAIDSGKGEVKFTVGSGKPNKLILDLSNFNHEEEIKADSQDTIVVPVTPKKKEVKIDSTAKSEKIIIAGKKIEIKGISKDDAEKLKNLGAMIGALGGMMQGANNGAENEKQKTDNAEADKEFDDMSKDLDMYTK